MPLFIKTIIGRSGLPVSKEKPKRLDRRDSLPITEYCQQFIALLYAA